LAPRHLHRYREIIQTFARHGFAALIAQLQLNRRLNLPRGLLRRQPPANEATPAEHLRLALEELGPTFIKLGQLLSTRPDLIPPDYIAELRYLQDDVRPVPWAEIKPLIEAELGQPISRCFATFETTPLAAASLAQVHAATLFNGRQVVAKVQRPQLESTIDTDLEILYDLARLAQQRTALGNLLDLVAVVDEFAITLRAELDFYREGQNAERFQEAFADDPAVYLPTIHWEYTTRRLLVMERLYGIKIDDVQALDAAEHDRHQIALDCARIIIHEVFEEGFFHADPHPGNYLVMSGGVIGAMDFGKVGYLAARDRGDLSRLYVATVQLDAAAVVDQLVQMGIADHHIDRPALERDVQRFLRRFAGLPLRDLQMREVIEALMNLAFRHHMRLPSNWWLLMNTLGMMEGLGRTLDPDFDMFAVSEPYVRRFQRRMVLPTEWGPAAMRSAVDWATLLQRFPRQTARLLDQMGHEGLNVQVHLPEMSDAAKRLDRMTNRLALSILAAAFVIALAWLVPQLDLQAPWLAWLIFGAFGLANLLGIWLLWKIWRSG
jgi:ubiquinone biosynthesis protein